MTGGAVRVRFLLYHSKMDREFESIILSTEAEMLLADMRDGCMVSKSGVGAPAVVMPRQKLIPQTRGQASDRAIDELVENDLAQLSGDTRRNCKLTKKGERTPIASPKGVKGAASRPVDAGRTHGVQVVGLCYSDVNEPGRLQGGPETLSIVRLARCGIEGIRHPAQQIRASLFFALADGGLQITYLKQKFAPCTLARS